MWLQKPLTASCSGIWHGALTHPARKKKRRASAEDFDDPNSDSEGEAEHTEYPTDAPVPHWSLLPQL